jgi:hypothetical protein
MVAKIRIIFNTAKFKRKKIISAVLNFCCPDAS